MNKVTAQKRIDTLRLTLEYHRHLYHVLDTPEIEDEVYDSLMRELGDLEERYPEFDSPMSPTKRIGGDVLTHFEKVTHTIPQWSFDNAFSLQDLKDWEDRNITLLRKQGVTMLPTYVAEMKIDGLKIVLTYRDGVLVQGATRGDGTIGENITENIKTIKSIPTFLKDKISITVIGEAWIKKKDLERINKERQALGLPLYANTRNLAAGTLRQLDSKVVAKRNLQLFCYDIEGGEYETQEEELETLSSYGFLVNTDRRVCMTLEDVQKFYEQWIDKRKKQDYGIDGLVIKINERELWDTLGYTAKSPRAGIAYKFPAEVVATKLVSITCQVGRTGAVTPVAELEPALLAGSVVKRATLHNAQEIERLGVRIGDTVSLRKAGDVIPEIFDVFTDLRLKNSKPFVMPTVCPECSSVLVYEIVGKEKSAALYCKNDLCPAKHIEELIHFVSKKGLNIEGLGDKIIESFHDIGLISNAPSIFKLKKGDIAGLEGFGEKSEENILSSIDKARLVPLNRFLYSLGIRHIGEQTAKDLATHFLTLNTLRWASFEELSSVSGVGEKVACSLTEYFKDKKKIKELEQLLQEITLEETHKKSGNIFSGMTFVITGTLPTLSRDEAKKLIEDNGGKVSSSVSIKTSYLLKGENGGSKAMEALKFGVKTIEEGELLRMVKM